MTAMPTALDATNAVIESMILRRHDLGREIRELAAKRKLLVIASKVDAAAVDEIERQGIAAETRHRQLTSDLSEMKRHRAAMQGRAT